MVFSSLKFLFVFAPIYYLVQSLLPAKARNAWLLLASLGFYAYGALANPFYLVLLIVSIAVNYLLGLAIGGGKKRKFCLALGLIYNFGCLFIFKYLDFFLQSAGWLLGRQLPLANLVLPIGISFYTFQISSYLIDVYRGQTAPEYSLIRLGAYLSMFPQLIAGPIVTYGSVAASLHKRNLTLQRFNAGLIDFTLGLGFKVLLANQLGGLWRNVQTIGFISVSTPLAWLGIVAYSLQLYFDFYGYSLMAIGLGRMMGFTLPQNFDHPYVSVSMTEFWRRWHITLGAWFREYVYIPLGGSRAGRVRTIRNLLVVWLLTGLWHGASLNFLLWGLANFLLVMLEKLGLQRLFRRVRPLGHLYMLLAIPLLWSIFAITDLQQLGVFFSRLFPFFGEGQNVYAQDFSKYLNQYGVLLACGCLFATGLPERWFARIRKTPLGAVLLLAVFWGSVYCLYMGMDDPFLYFRF